jgi:D-sedoheptulose 7-phosphate isomerase
MANMNKSDLIKAIKKARFVFVCGNGGSASNAEHFTNDLFKKGIKAICLNSNVSLTTMIANDHGYHYIFAKQLELFADYQDLLVTISCSGKSPNIFYVQELADHLNIPMYAFETFKDSEEHSFKDYGLLENKHLQLIHAVTAEL